MIRVLALSALVFLAACTTTTRPLSSSSAAAPPDNSLVLLVQPDIALSILSAAGQPEPRADWSEAARDNVAAALTASLQADGHQIQPFDPAAVEGRADQLVRLHSAVGGSVLTYHYGLLKLPTHPPDTFSWTLGPGTQVISEQTNARYALFVTARGSYASDGRMAAAIGLALLGVSVPLGGQQIFASLVDLQTGDITWFNVATASPSADMRTPEGAQALVDRMMADSPL